MQPLPSLDKLADSMYHNYHTQARVHVLMMSLLNILTKFYLIITKDFLKDVAYMNVITSGEGFCLVLLGEFVIRI